MVLVVALPPAQTASCPRPPLEGGQTGECQTQKSLRDGIHTVRVRHSTRYEVSCRQYSNSEQGQVGEGEEQLIISREIETDSKQHSLTQHNHNHRPVTGEECAVRGDRKRSYSHTRIQQHTHTHTPSLKPLLLVSTA